MKTACCSLWLALWAGAGCVILPANWEKQPPPSAPAPAEPSRPRPPVTADDITESNAHEKAEALRQELDRETVRHIIREDAGGVEHIGLDQP